MKMKDSTVTVAVEEGIDTKLLSIVLRVGGKREFEYEISPASPFADMTFRQAQELKKIVLCARGRQTLLP